MNDWLSVVYALGVIQGILLAIILFLFKSANRKGNTVLGVLLVLFSWFLFEEYCESSGLTDRFPKVLLSTFTFDLAFGPLIYLYALSLTGQSEQWKRKGIHLLPFILLTFSFWIFHFGTREGAFAWLMPSPSAMFICMVNAKLIFESIYFFMAISVLRKNTDAGTFRLPGKQINTRWLYRFLIIILIAMIPLLILFNLDILYPGRFPQSDIYSGWLITICIYAIAFTALRNPLVFKGMENPDYYLEKIKETTAPRYKTSSLTDSQKKEYTRKLLAFMEQVKPYKDFQVKLEDVSKGVNIPTHQLSQIINEVLEKNFYEFINHYRVKEAKEMIAEPGTENKSLLGIAMDAGFNSKSTFNRVFKEFTGVTPSAYKKHTTNS